MKLGAGAIWVVKGHIGWGVTTTPEEDDDTHLTSPVVDQAAPHGLLKKVRDLGMLLVLVICVEPSQADASDVIR